jgi:hypothetical protein
MSDGMTFDPSDPENPRLKVVRGRTDHLVERLLSELHASDWSLPELHAALRHAASRICDRADEVDADVRRRR